MPTPQEIAENLRRTAKPAGYIHPEDPPEADETDLGPSPEFEHAAESEGDRAARRAVVFGADEPGAERAGALTAAELEQERAETPVTYGGEAVPTAFAHPLEASRALYDATLGRLAPEAVTRGLERVGDTAQAVLAGQAKTAGALLPQHTDTPYQAEQRAASEQETEEARARADAALHAAGLSPEDLAAAEHPGTIDPPTDPSAPTVDLGLPVAALSPEQERVIAAHPETRAAIEAFNAAKTAGTADQRARDDAAAIESPSAYALRMLAALPSAAAGAGETLLTGNRDAIPDRIREGTGFTGAGADAGRHIGGLVGHPEIGAAVGGTAGFLGDLVTPTGVESLAGRGVEGLSEAERALPRELRPSALERALVPAPPERQERELQEIRNQVSGIPEAHHVEARQLSGATGAPIADASTFTLARGIARVVDPPAATNQIPLFGQVASNPGISFLRGLTNALGKPATVDEVSGALPPALAGLADRARALLEAGPVAGVGQQLEQLTHEVAAAVGVPLAPGDAGRALGGAYLASRTWEVVSGAVSRAADPALGSLRAEIAVGPTAFLDAVRTRSPELAATIDQASAIGDSMTAFGRALEDRALVAARLDKFNAAANAAPLPLRKAWTFLQQTVGYGTPLIGPDGGMLVSEGVGAVARGGLNQASRMLRSGMLSGYAVPNPKFFVNNFLTGPAIVMSTLGPRYAAASLLSWDGLRVLRAAGGAQSSAVIVQTAEKAYTAADIARLVAENGLKSQASVELRSRGIDALVEWGQHASDGRLLSHVKSLGGYGANIWTAVAEASDQLFRVNVLTAALRDGRPEQEALTLARESLFDYGKTTDFERNVLGKVVWFWSFRRGNYRALVKNILSHPTRLSALATYNNNMSEATPHGDDTSFLATEGYAENTPQWRMVNDPESGLRYALNGPPIPQVQAIEDMTHAGTLLALMVQDYQRKGAEPALYRGAVASLSQVNPVAQAIAAGFGIDLAHGPDAKTSNKLDARLAWYLQQIPGAWQTAVATFDLEEVSPDKAKIGGNFIPGAQSDEGSGQWQIGSDSGRRAWADWMFVLALTGQQRAFREYAPALAGIDEAIGHDPAAVSPQLGNAPGTTPWERLGIAAGLLTATPEPAFDRTSDRNEAAREREVLP